MVEDNGVAELEDDEENPSGGGEDEEGGIGDRSRSFGIMWRLFFHARSPDLSKQARLRKAEIEKAESRNYLAPK